MSKIKTSLIDYIREAENILETEYGLNLADVHVPTLADSWREGWSVQDYIDWFAGKYELQPIKVFVESF